VGDYRPPAGCVRTTFQNVRYVDAVPGKTHGLDDPGEQLAGSPDERLSLGVFIGPWGFADEHQVGIRIADAENRLGAGTGEMRAECTNRHAVLNEPEQVPLADDVRA
jgi:hypothetical protein